MERRVSVAFWLLVVLVAIALYPGLAPAATVSEPVVLVASSRQDGSPYEQTVAIVASLPDGGHFGFIVNRPTRFSLQALFPKDEAASKVNQRVYVGGPTATTSVFAVIRSDTVSDGQLRLAPGVVAALDPAAVDAVIRSVPNDARYFLGLMVWQPGELEREIAESLWEVNRADADVLFEERTTRGLWNTLRAPMAKAAPDGAML